MTQPTQWQPVPDVEWTVHASLPNGEGMPPLPPLTPPPPPLPQVPAPDTSPTA